MKNKKNIIIILIIILIVGMILALNSKKNETIKYDNKNYTGKVNPISKEYAIKILQAEYGNLITISEKDIKKIGQEYVVDVLLKEESEANHQHEESMSLGIHKINIYTGELIFPN